MNKPRAKNLKNTLIELLLIMYVEAKSLCMENLHTPLTILMVVTTIAQIKARGTTTLAMCTPSENGKSINKLPLETDCMAPKIIRAFTLDFRAVASSSHIVRETTVSSLAS